jgi:threonine aldolase
MDPKTVETNLVFFDVDERYGTADWFCTSLREQQVLMLPEGRRRVRAAAHLDVTADDIDRAIHVIHRTIKSRSAA